MRKTLSVVAIVVTCCAFTRAAGATPILLVNASGLLTGADGVDVGGTLYDVRFADGSCISLYSGCDDVSDFPFPTQAGALAASQALLDQVLIESPLGLFDSIPGLTVGCELNEGVCSIYTPYAVFFAVPPPGDVAAAFAQNTIFLGGLFGEDNVGLFGFLGDRDTTGIQETFATWSPAATVVPEPASLSLLGLGLASMGVRRWRKRTRVAR